MDTVPHQIKTAGQQPNCLITKHFLHFLNLHKMLVHAISICRVQACEAFISSKLPNHLEILLNQQASRALQQTLSQQARDQRPQQRAAPTQQAPVMFSQQQLLELKVMQLLNSLQVTASCCIHASLMCKIANSRAEWRAAC